MTRQCHDPEASPRRGLPVCSTARTFISVVVMVTLLVVVVVVVALCARRCSSPRGSSAFLGSRANSIYRSRSSPMDGRSSSSSRDPFPRLNFSGCLSVAAHRSQKLRKHIGCFFAVGFLLAPDCFAPRLAGLTGLGRTCLCQLGDRAADHPSGVPVQQVPHEERIWLRYRIDTE